MFVTKNGMGLNASKSDIPVQGRISGGVKGVMLADGDEVVSANQVSAGQSICLISNKAFAKQINTSEIEIIARYRKGVKVFDLKGDNSSGTSVVCAGVFGSDDEVVIQTDSDEYSSISVSSIAEDTRSSKGKSLSVENDKSVNYAVIRKNN